MVKRLPKKIKLASLFLLSLLLFGFPSSTGNVFAADAVPPPGNIPCKGNEKNPEFAIDRPYQASPCGDSPVSYWCGSGVVISLGTVKVPYCDSHAGEKRSCPVDITKDQKIDVDLTNVQLPILGNTEQTQNSVAGADQIDEGTKTSSYVAWYLNEGPLKKLLPSAIQDAQRIQVISAATKSEPENHNQIVACGESSIPIIGNILHIGTITPKDCYQGGGAKATGTVFRLDPAKGDDGWGNGDLSFWNTGMNTLVDTLTSLLPSIPSEVIRQSVGDHWNKRIPPLPWSDKDGKPFASDVLYQKAYNEWRGKTCIIVPVINSLVCLDNVLVPNKYADLYQYVPLANTTDKSGEQSVTDTIVSITSGSIDKQSSVISHSPELFLAHSLEDYQLSTSLKSTYVPKKAAGGSAPNDVERNNECRIIPSRTNSGDSATFTNIKSHLEVDVNYHISQIGCTNFGYDEKNGAYTADCSADISATINSVSKTPYADEIWSNTVAGSDSIFRRIYPKTGAGSPVSCIADTPASSNASYTLTGNSSAGVGLVGVSEPDKSMVLGSSDTVDAQLYYPHYGGVSDYFLKGIQQALRPQGYGEGTPENGQYCSNVACGDLPKGLPKASGSCAMGSTSLSIPDSFKAIIEAAAQTYKIPPGLILGIMYGEGAFNPGRYSWTDTNVKNWASCERLPNCSPGGNMINSVVPFIGTYWNTLAKRILPDLRKIDPSKTQADPCNLLDATFAMAKDLHDNAGGSPQLTGRSCFGIPMSSSNPVSCSWSDSQYETAIRVWEFGTDYNSTYKCGTAENSCATGGMTANCAGGDNCETITNRYQNPSHNACVWNVAHGF